MADLTPPPHLPAAPNSGPAPVPYAGPDLSPEPPVYDLGEMTVSYPGALVMAEAQGGVLQDSAGEDDPSAGVADAPYVPGEISPVFAGGDADAGGRDDVAGTVAGSVAAATGRYIEHESDTHAQGSVIGDLVTLPPGVLDLPQQPPPYDWTDPTA